MDDWYDFKTAEHKEVNMAYTSMAADIDFSKHTEGGRIIKAMVPGSGKHRQESIFTVVGALKRYKLPAVKKTDISTAQVKYARQHATIVGLGDTNGVMLPSETI
ncbi:hypothetical protein C8R47DRAFT_1082640 [Mycena vitilis]|nr:hypothetical protein C8R47DRAFT_1082640 [Mycena vitilis]